MTFTANGHTLVPFYQDDAGPHHVYFHRSEPEIVFGSVDSGVQNPQNSDGLSFLDAVWEQAPFKNDEKFQRAVAAAAASWVRRGLLTSAEESAVNSAAARARLPA